MRSVLYITYDGLLEPLGQSQVLAYLGHLCSDYAIHVISYEKKNDRGDAVAMAAMRSRLAGLSIGWTPLAYHKRPSALATGFDVLVGMLVGLWIARSKGACILHVRSYVPALIALPIRRFTGGKLLFDMRGFWADERVDGGLWPRHGWLYRLAKALEHNFLRAADHIVTLTEASARELRSFPALRSQPKPLSVIPTCADLALFRPSSGPRPPGLVVGYVGSIGTWYLFNETLLFFRALQRRRPEARLLVINRNDHAVVRSLVAAAGIAPGDFEVVSAQHDEVPRWINRMHLGVALIRPSFSKIASAPTKLAEYLGCGVPCLGNSGVGDVADLLRTHHVGIVLDGFSSAQIEAAAEQATVLLQDSGIAARCEQAARDVFSLERGIGAYRAIYESIRGTSER